MRVTLKNIAERANVSQAAVSIAINNKRSSRVSEAKRNEILALVKELDYKPNVSARNLKGKGSNTIGIIGGFAGVSVQSGLLWRITTLLQEKGYHSLVVNATIGNENPVQTINEFIAHGVDGIVIASLSGIDFDIPIPHIRVDTGENCDIGIDKEQGGYEITKHLIEKHGHERIAFLAFTDVRYSRYFGHVRAIEESGIISDPNLFISLRDNSLAEMEIMNLVEKKRVSAFCCSNDYIAAHLISLLRRNGAGVPDDVAVTGFDGLTLTEYVDPPISTVVQPMFELAERSVEMLLNRLDGKSDVTRGHMLSPRLHVAESCGCEKETLFMPFADFRSFDTIEGCVKYSFFRISK
jgi:LacI family transcriptional regulator